MFFAFYSLLIGLGPLKSLHLGCILGSIGVFFGLLFSYCVYLGFLRVFLLLTLFYWS